MAMKGKEGESSPESIATIPRAGPMARGIHLDRCLFTINFFVCFFFSRKEGKRDEHLTAYIASVEIVRLVN